MNILDSNHFGFLSLIGPYVMTGYFLLSSLFNNNAKGFIYLAGVVIMMAFTNFYGHGDYSGKQECLVFFNSSISLSNKLPIGVLVYTFTFFYLLIPMIKTTMINFSILTILLMLIGVDSMIQITKK